jgi:hypothetical protein
VCVRQKPQLLMPGNALAEEPRPSPCHPERTLVSHPAALVGAPYAVSRGKPDATNDATALHAKPVGAENGVIGKLPRASREALRDTFRKPDLNDNVARRHCLGAGQPAVVALIKSPTWKKSPLPSPRKLGAPTDAASASGSKIRTQPAWNVPMFRVPLVRNMEPALEPHSGAIFCR